MFGLLIGLARPHFSIKARCIKQLLMATAFSQTAIVEHQNSVGIRDCRQPMRNRQRRSVCADFAQSGQNVLLCPAVESAGRLVQHQDRRVFHKRTGDGDPLFFAA